MDFQKVKPKIKGMCINHAYEKYWLFQNICVMLFDVELLYFILVPIFVYFLFIIFIFVFVCTCYVGEPVFLRFIFMKRELKWIYQEEIQPIYFWMCKFYVIHHFCWNKKNITVTQNFAITSNQPNLRENIFVKTSENSITIIK